jgi:hypothetical protein
MRTEVIRARLSSFASEKLSCQVGTVEKDEWLNWPLPGHLRFGWMPPIRVDDDEEKLLVMFSPELMAAVTGVLSDEQFEDYMTLVEFVLARHVEYIDRPGDEVHQLIEDQLYTEVPDALMLRYNVEAQALGTVIPVS